MWRYRVIKMIRKAQRQNRIAVTNAFLEIQYHKVWIVHFAKPTSSPWQTITYLGRYLKRPPLSQSRLVHYDGKQVIFSYLNHRNGKYQKGIYSTEEFIHRFIQHIPDKGFRLIRYYGILANRVRRTLLPIVYELLNQTIKSPKFIGWAGLLKISFGIDPLKCIICKSTMLFSGITLGLNFQELKANHEKFATQRKVVFC
jgi:Putative transposase